MTHTFAELELSPTAYAEIRQKLEAAGYQHAFDGTAIDMHGIGVVPGPIPPAPEPVLGMWERVTVRKDLFEAAVHAVQNLSPPHEDLVRIVLLMQESFTQHPMTSQDAAGKNLSDITGGQFTHDQIASRVRMLYRDDLDHEAVCLMGRDRIVWLAARNQELVNRNAELYALVNNPQTKLFLESVRAEVAHQVERWGTVGDRAKAPQDWYWLVGYLAGKALASAIAGDIEKAKHHTISSGAVLANWHAHLTLGEGGFTPGASDIQRFLEDTFGREFVEPSRAAP